MRLSIGGLAVMAAGVAVTVLAIGAVDSVVLSEAADPTWVCAIEPGQDPGRTWHCALAVDQPAGQRVYVGPRDGINEAHRQWLTD